MTAQATVRYKVGGDGGLAMQVNDKAPDITLLDQDEKPVSLKDFQGKNVVLFFFPKADTPG
jgi:peroxiredoxin Q/BCP